MAGPAEGRGNRATAIAVLVWVPALVLLDRGAGLPRQLLLGAGSWALLVALLRRETPLVRAQVVVVVGFATVVEYLASPWLGVYDYRLHTVPPFVPPGHGLVYLGALALGRLAFARAHSRALVAATVAVAGGYALWGLVWSARLDVLGALWYLCLLGFLRWGRSRLLYVGAFVVVTALEVLGTWAGSWTWATHDPTGLVAIGNPPSVAAGGYGWFDLAALAAAPALLVALARGREAWVSRRPVPAAPADAAARSS